MFVLVQIPCRNEMETLGEVLRQIPKSLPGVSRLETVLLDDASEDDSVEVARQAGVNHVVSLKRHLGLARVFSEGLRFADKMGADILINVDADLQHDPAEIPRLLEPVLADRADMVIGARDFEKLKHMSRWKKLLQYLGAAVVGFVSRNSVPDATSGFRVYNRKAFTTLNVTSAYTYTLETLIQSGHVGLTVVSIPIAAPARFRKSRLMRGNWHYVIRSTSTIVRIFLMYAPLRVFVLGGAFFVLIGLLGVGRFFYFWFRHLGAPEHTQSLLLSGVFLILGILFGSLGLLADLVSRNRKLIEEMLREVRDANLKK